MLKYCRRYRNSFSNVAPESMLSNTPKSNVAAENQKIKRKSGPWIKKEAPMDKKTTRKARKIDGEREPHIALSGIDV